MQKALSRTLLLMRDDVTDAAADEELLHALLSTTIVIAANEGSVQGHSAQTAVVTLALLLARSGHRVYVVGPHVQLRASQPPLDGIDLLDSLRLVDSVLMPISRIECRAPSEMVDLQVLIGASSSVARATSTIRLTAGAWSASMEEFARGEVEGEIAIGGMLAAVMASVEAFKRSMWKLRRYARAKRYFDELYADAAGARIVLAPEDTTLIPDVGIATFISAGAITNSTLFALARVQGLRGQVCIFDDDHVEPSNLNRYMLMTRSHVGARKVDALGAVDFQGLLMTGLPTRFTGNERLNGRVLIGADDIPTRWRVQELTPDWLCVGATSHWMAMVSCHSATSSCAGCAHPRDDVAPGPIPTVAFVSFWAGLLQAVRLLKDRSGETDEQQQIVWPFTQTVHGEGVPFNSRCPIRARVHPGIPVSGES